MSLKFSQVPIENSDDNNNEIFEYLIDATTPPHPVCIGKNNFA